MSLGEDLSPGVKLISAAILLILVMFSINFLYNFLVPPDREPAISLSLSEPPANRDPENHIRIIEIVNEGREGLDMNETAIILSEEKIKNYEIEEGENIIAIPPGEGRIILSHYNSENGALTNPEADFLWVELEEDDGNNRLEIRESAVLKKEKGSSIGKYLGISGDMDVYLSVYYFPANGIIFEETIGIH